MGLVKHILKTSEGAFGLSDDAAAGMSVHSLVQKKTQLLHEEEAMLAQFMNKETTSAAECTLQQLAKTRVKEISKQQRVLSTWSRKHSAQQLTVPDEMSFSRPSSAYRSVLSHVSAPHQTDAPDILRLGTPGIFNNFGGGFGAMALESNAQVQQSWPAVASVVMTPWGAALSPLPPLALSAESAQQVQNVAGGDQNVRNKDSEIILLQQKHIERQQRLLDDLINLQQKQPATPPQWRSELSLHKHQTNDIHKHHPVDQLQPPQFGQPASPLVLERVVQLEENARKNRHSLRHPAASARSSAPVLRTRTGTSAAIQPSNIAAVAPSRDCNQGVMLGNGVYRDERGMLRNGGPQAQLSWDAAVAICRHLDSVPHLVRLSQTCVFFKRVCQLTPSLWHTVDLTPVGSFEVMMRSTFETRITTTNVATLLTQRCTDGDLLVFRASSVPSVTDELMPLLASKSHNLLEIDVGWHNDTGPAVTDAGIIMVLKHAQQLQVFKAAWVATLTDASLLALSAHCRHVTHIDVSGAPGVSDVGITSICESNTGPQLSFMSVYGCERLTDASLMRLARRCSSLVDVNVGGCSRMSGDAIVLLCSACRHLVHLNASGLFRLNDLHVFLASRRLLQLQTLSLAFCRNVGAESISALTSNHPPHAIEPQLINDRGNEVCVSPCSFACLHCTTAALYPPTLLYLPLNVDCRALQAVFTTVKRPDYTLLGEDAYAQFKMEPSLSHLDLRGCGPRSCC
jgi:hypothetical protein